MYHVQGLKQRILVQDLGTKFSNTLDTRLDMVQRGALENLVDEASGSLTSSATIRFSRRSVLHKVT